MSPRQLPVLVSKIGPPPVPTFAVDRARLIAALTKRDWRIAVVTGGAGTGKSVVAAQFCAALTDATPAWVSLDSDDDRPERFWLYLITALRRAVPGAFEGVAAQVPSARTEFGDLVTELLVDASSLPRPIVIVLDDLHTIRDPDILGGIKLLVDHLPPQLRLLITSRSDPSLPIARWRARSWTVEIRQDELACSTDEALALLAALGEHRLTLDDVDDLRAHTEGWVAALHLAALAMNGRDDAAAVARQFTGRHRMIADLLMSEVLDAQVHDVQELLLRTSVLEHFDGDMADALTGRGGGAAALAALSSHISFLVPVDDQRTTYRYHPLLRDLLQLELERRHPNAAVALRRTAATALEARGEAAEAIMIHLASGDLDQAFALAFSTAYRQHDRGDLAAMASWVDLFPHEYIADSIDRMLVYSFSIGACGRLDEAQAWLERAQHRMLAESESSERTLRYADALHLMLFTIGGGVDDGIESGRRVVTAVDEGIDIGTLGARARPNLARAYLLNDDPDGAERVLDGGVFHDELAATLLAPAIRARVALRSGRLGRAIDHATRALTAAATLDAPHHLGALDACLARTGVLVERNQHVDAVAGIEHIREIVDRHPEALAYQVLGRLDEVRLTVANDGLDRGFVVIAQLRRLIGPRSHPPLWRVVDALAARWHIEAHDLVRAEQLIDRLTPGPRHALLAARLDLAQGRPADAMRRLADADFATVRDRLGADLLLARATRELGSPDTVVYVERAARPAAEHGFVRTILEEGPDVVRAIRRAAEHLETPDGDRLAVALGAPPSRPRSAHPAVVLSERERAVLRFLPTRLTNQEIALECFMSVNTVKTHLKSIYSKLDVSSRSDAVARARVLALLAP